MPARTNQRSTRLFPENETDRIHEAFGDRLWVLTWTAIAVVRVCWYAVMSPCYQINDSSAYYNYNSTWEVLTGHVTRLQAPLYGMLFNGIKAIFGQNYLMPMVYLQVVISTLSLFLFARLLGKLGIKKPWACLCTFLYGVSPAVIGWENVILTESFSLSMAVAFFYCVVMYVQEHQLRYGLLAIALTTLMVFLRPQFLTYLAILLVFCILKLFFPAGKQERRSILRMLAALAVSLMLVLLYCYRYQKTMGIFSMTTAGVHQNLVDCLTRGYWADFDDAELVQFIQDTAAAPEDNRYNDANAWKIVFAAETEFGLPRIKATIRQFFREHPAKLIDYFKLMCDYSIQTFVGYGAATQGRTSPSFLYQLFPLLSAMFSTLTVGQVMFASLAEGVVMLAVWVHRRTMPWIHMALFSITFCTVFLTFFVTCGEYVRTMITVIPYFYCMTAMFLQYCADRSVMLTKSMGERKE